MGKKLVECEHCGGKKTCTKSGGKSCKACLQAAGRHTNQWGTVRCSYCGGIGKIWLEEEDEEVKEEEVKEEEVKEEKEGE